MDESRKVPSPHDLGISLDSSDPKAKKEQLELEQQSNRHRRTESFRDWLSRGILGIVIVAVGVIIVAILLTAWHNMAPECWRWLKSDDLQNLYSFLFSGAVVSAITLHLRRHL